MKMFHGKGEKRTPQRVADGREGRERGKRKGIEMK